MNRQTHDEMIRFRRKEVRGTMSDDTAVPNHSHRSTNAKHPAGVVLCGAILIAVAGLASGCGGSQATIIASGLPTPPATTTTNTYTGTQSPGLWSLTLDNTQDAFSYQATTYPASPDVATTGSISSVNGFLNLISGSSTAAGYAVERPSRGLLLRPGDDTTSMIAAVQQTSCFPIGGDVTFQFVYMPSRFIGNGPLTINNNTGNGHIVASTNADGSAWQFGDYISGPDSFGDPTSFSGACSVTNGQASITVPATANYTRPTTITINQAGFIFIDHSIASPNTTTNIPEASEFGIVQPSSALVTANIVAGKYSGFLYEPGNTTATTQAMSFGTVTAGSGTSIVGGVFPNDDITQAPGTETTITLGTQNTTNHGLYSSATVTRPDPSGYCVSRGGGTAGVDANGNATCTFAAHVVAGSADGKFVLFLVAFDPTQYAQPTLGIYLFQQ